VTPKQISSNPAERLNRRQFWRRPHLRRQKALPPLLPRRRADRACPAISPRGGLGGHRKGSKWPSAPEPHPPPRQPTSNARKPKRTARHSSHQRLLAGGTVIRGFARRPFGKGAKSTTSSCRGFGWLWVSGVGSSRGRWRQA
jgi:hypothetical protein